jgi:hypothetical protein
MATNNRMKSTYKDEELKQVYAWIQAHYNLPAHKRSIEFLFPKFLTLTFSKDPVTTANARALVEAWLRGLPNQPNKKCPLQWVYTIAHGGSNGRLHVHVLLFNRLAPVASWPHGTVDSKDCIHLSDIHDMLRYIKRNKNKETKRLKNVTNINVPRFFRLQFQSKKKGIIRRTSNRRSPVSSIISAPKTRPQTQTVLSAQAGAPGGPGAVAPAWPQGITGSGKTHYAREKISRDPSWVRVSREDIRAEITGADPRTSGYYEQDHKELEKHVAGMHLDQIRYWLQQGYNVIVDGPHLHPRYIYNLKNTFDHMANILVTTFDHEDLTTITSRMYQNRMPVDVGLMQQQWMHMEDLLKGIKLPLNQLIQKNTKTSAKIRHIINASSQPDCVIVSIDGCLADYRGMRDYRNDGDCYKDRVVEPMRKLLQQISGTKDWFTSRFVGSEAPEIVYVTRRTQEHENNTRQWLMGNPPVLTNPPWARRSTCRNNHAGSVTITLHPNPPP